MSFVNPPDLVRAIKGQPASIVVALLLARRPMTARELQHWTGYSEELIGQAVRRLIELGWVSALGPRGPWTLSPNRILLLMDKSEVRDAGAPDQPLSARDPAPGSRSAESADGDLVDADGKEEERFVRSLHALFDAGIQEPTAGRLARLPHVTPEYIAAHVALANAQGYHLGLAIYRMERGWPMPQTKAVLTVEDRIRRFLDDP